MAAALRESRKTYEFVFGFFVRVVFIENLGMMAIFYETIRVDNHRIPIQLRADVGADKIEELDDIQAVDDIKASDWNPSGQR